MRPAGRTPRAPVCPLVGSSQPEKPYRRRQGRGSARLCAVEVLELGPDRSRRTGMSEVAHALLEGGVGGGHPVVAGLRQTAGVLEQVPDGDGTRCSLIGDLEPWQVRSNRIVQINFAVLGELEDRHCSEHFGY